MKTLCVLFIALLSCNFSGAQNVGIKTTTPVTDLDVNGGIKTKYSSQVVLDIAGTGIQEFHIPLTDPVPLTWNYSNTMVLVSNAYGPTGVVHQAKLETNSSIQLTYSPDAAGTVRLSFIIFLTGALPVSYPFPVKYMCNQLWMIKNLDVTHYRNGEEITHVTDSATWSIYTLGAWCWYKNDSATYAAAYGRLYNWYAVNDSRGLAPEGWHVASDSEWNALVTCVGGVSVAGGKLKESGTVHWLTPNTGADNSSGFSAVPGGYRDYIGNFGTIGNNCYFWTTTKLNSTRVYDWLLLYNSAGINKFNERFLSGLSVRCVKD